ncbi:MAG TPA: ATP synthase F1 subunit delta [Pyrinomonadaceae bacterium]|nr:ATP synthase F1 subunit delta [Pyrinomonadaceae bacterium]
MQMVARRYATALADVVTARGEAQEVKEELAAWSEMMQSNEQLLEVFRNPTIPYEQKRKVLDTLIERSRVRPTTSNFLQVLLQNHRLAELSEVNKRFAQILDERSGVVSAEVTTARPVAQSSQDALRTKLTAMTGKSVRLSFTTDEELIGGIVTRIGSTIYDGSVRNQLQQVRERLAGK